MYSIIQKNFARVSVIENIYTSSIYGLNRQNFTSLVCFRNKHNANHVLESITIFKNAYSKYPSNNSLCLFNKKEYQPFMYTQPYEYGLYVRETYLDDLMDISKDRQMGILLIEDIFQKNDMFTLQSIELYPNIPIDFTKVRGCIESDYNL